MATYTGPINDVGSIDNAISTNLGRASGGDNSIGNRTSRPTTNTGPTLQHGGDSGYSGHTRSSYAFEQVFANLTPFQFPDDARPGNPLWPIIETGGLVFPYNPSISEGVSVKYDSIELTHTNESYNAYRGTDNVRINISDATWTCDTFSNAVYALSVLHFFRSYSLMDFGRYKTGRPPSPMWFSAYGNYAFNRVPCLMEKADWTFPNDVDYIGVPEFGSAEYNSGSIKSTRNGADNYTWLPMEFKVSSISLIVQHTPTYWNNFNLADYWSGKMISGGNTHTTGPSPTLPSSTYYGKAG